VIVPSAVTIIVNGAGNIELNIVKSVEDIIFNLQIGTVCIHCSDKLRGRCVAAVVEIETVENNAGSAVVNKSYG